MPLVRLISILILFIPGLLPGQSIRYENKKLTHIIHDIEHRTGWVFNYDPKVSDEVVLNCTLDFSNIRASLRKALHPTACDLTYDNQTLYLIPPEKTDYTICGFVTDALTGDTLPHAYVAWQELNGTMADENGRFFFQAKAYKNENITIGLLGYSSRTFMVQDMETPGCGRYALDLDPAFTFATDIIIRDYLIRGISEGHAYSSFKIDQLRWDKEIVTPVYDALKNLQWLPGISSVDATASRLNIRGSEPDHNMVLWEGAPLYDAGHLEGMITAINPFLIESVQVFKGVYSPIYDNRIGGIVDIELPDDITGGHHGGFGVSTTDAHAFVKQELVRNKLSIHAGARTDINRLLGGSPTLRQYGEKVFSVAPAGATGPSVNTQESELDMRFHDINFKVVYQPDETWRMESALISISNKYLFETEFGEEDLENTDSLAVSSWAASSHISHFWPSGATSEAVFSLARYDNSFNKRNTDVGGTQLLLESIGRNSISDIQLGLNHRFSQGGINWHAGYVFDMKETLFTLNTSSLYQPDQNTRLDLSGVFHHGFINAHLPINTFDIHSGIRATYHPEQNSWRVSPRVSIQRKLGQGYKVNMAAGRFYQYISQLFDLGQNGFGLDNKAWVLAGPMGSNILEADKYNLGFIYNKKDWLIDLAFYVHRSRGVTLPITSTSNTLTLDNRGNASAHGLELLVNRNWHPFRLWLTYSLSENLVRFPSLDDLEIFTNQDQRHKVNLVCQVSWGPVDLSVSHRFHSGSPYSMSLEVEEQEDEEGPHYEVSYEGINTRRLAPYHSTDLSARWIDIELGHNIRGEIRASVLNIWNRRNAYIRNTFLTNSDPSDSAPELLDIERLHLGRTVSLLLRIYW